MDWEVAVPCVELDRSSIQRVSPQPIYRRKTSRLDNPCPPKYLMVDKGHMHISGSQQIYTLVTVSKEIQISANIQVTTNIPPNEWHSDHNTGNNTPRDESPTNTIKTTIATEGLKMNGLATGFGVGVDNIPRFVTNSLMEEDLPLSMSVACKGFRMILSFDMVFRKRSLKT